MDLLQGFALGGCMVVADFRIISYVVMSCVFALTTPVGIAIGLGVSSTYNPNSKAALGTEGVFDSISTGILIYMALVDLIAVDFQSKRIRSSRKLQISAYLATFAGEAIASQPALPSNLHCCSNALPQCCLLHSPLLRDPAILHMLDS